MNCREHAQVTAMSTNHHNSTRAHELPLVGESASVPVYDCHVIVSKPNDRGMIAARMSRLPHIACAAPTEREALRKIVDTFKAELKDYHNRGVAIPWVDPPQTPQAGESERWIPVHL
jgi:hypothetical protein